MHDWTKCKVLKLNVSDTSYGRVRSVGPTGIITALAGRRVGLNTTGIDGENGPAVAARFDQPNRLAVAPDGTLYVADTGNNRVRKVTPPLPGLSELGDTVIASPDGSELYVFNSRGRHQHTVDAMAKDDQGNPIIVWEFAYDDAETGFLTAVTDRDGNVTTFERGVAGGDLVITGPFGQQTAITLDANGYVASIANPGGEATSFQYTPDGLMTKVTDPRGNDTDYTDTAEGRLGIGCFDVPMGGDVDCDVLVCADDGAARDMTLALLDEIGLPALDAGPLRNAIALETLTPVLLHLNRTYGAKSCGIRITGL